MTRAPLPPALPEVLNFEGLGPCFFILGMYRLPKPGEFYVWGNPVKAYRARVVRGNSQWIVSPTHLAVPAHSYVKGGIVKVPPMESVPAPMRRINCMSCGDSVNVMDCPDAMRCPDCYDRERF